MLIGNKIRNGVKLHLVDWDTVCSPIFEGGLGIRNVRKFNQALLGKWLWRYAHVEIGFGGRVWVYLGRLALL
jgi:hypothetical protein